MGLIQHPTNPTSEKAIGAAIEVHCHRIAYHSQVPLPLTYKGVEISRGYLVDLLIEDSLSVGLYPRTAVASISTTACWSTSDFTSTSAMAGK